MCVCVPLLCLPNLTFNILTSDQRSSLAHSLWKHVEDWIILKHLEATFLPSRWSAARLAKHHWADAVVILRRITWHKVRGHGHSSRAKTAAAEMPSERKRRGDVEHFIELFFSFMTHINTFCWFFLLLVILWRLNHQHVVDKFNMPWLSGLEIDCYDLTVGTWIISPCRMWWSRATGWSCSQIWSCRKLPTTPGKCNSEPPVLASSSRRLRMRKNHPNAIKTRKSQVEMGQFQEK